MELSRKVRNLLLLSASALSLAFFIHLSTEVHEASLGLPELIGRIDLAAWQMLGKVRTPLLTSLVTVITHLGSGNFLAALILVASFVWCLRGQYRSALLLVLSGISASLASALLKSHYARARPDSLPHLVQADGFSFPSGHTLAATTIYLSLVILLAQQSRGKTARSVLVGSGTALIVGIGFSRIYLGVHYFSDVLGGFCVGVSIAALIGAISRRSKEKEVGARVE